MVKDSPNVEEPADVCRTPALLGRKALVTTAEGVDVNRERD
jgi:hypothetical protein